jgi:CRISPR-associated protein Csh2
MCNPNGDPDENRPRIDRVTSKNLVTEFRLKRTIRDYLQKQMGKPIFLRQELADVQTGTIKTIDQLAESEIEAFREGGVVIQEALFRKYIDLRLFGLLFAVEGVEIRKKKISLHFKQTGPVQFAIGQSLNKVEELSVRMTRVVPTREEAKAGTFGEKSIVRYGFIAFHGFVNDHVAKDVSLSEQDISDMMKGMWFGTTDLSTTSKYGQKSRLLIRVKYAKPNAYIGDLDQRIHMIPDGKDEEEKKLENISQFTLDISPLLNSLSKSKGDVQEIVWCCDSDLRCRFEGTSGSFEQLVTDWSEKTGIAAPNLLNEWST